MELRWYKKEVYDWKWNDRSDSWNMYLSFGQGPPRLQYRCTKTQKWLDLPTIIEKVIPPEPK